METRKPLWVACSTTCPFSWRKCFSLYTDGPSPYLNLCQCLTSFWHYCEGAWFCLFMTPPQVLWVCCSVPSKLSLVQAKQPHHLSQSFLRTLCYIPPIYHCHSWLGKCKHLETESCISVCSMNVIWVYILRDLLSFTDTSCVVSSSFEIKWDNAWLQENFKSSQFCHASRWLIFIL